MANPPPKYPPGTFMIPNAKGKKGRGKGQQKKQPVLIIPRVQPQPKAQPRPAKPTVGGGMVGCPARSAIPVLSFPVRYRQQATLTSSTTSGQSMIAIFAPCNDVLGQIFTQNTATGIPDAGSTLGATVAVVDPYITSMMTPGTNSSSVNAGSYRWTAFQVNVIITDAISAVSQSVQVLKWVQGGIGLASTGTPVNYGSVWVSMGEAINNDGARTFEVSNSRLLEGITVNSAMLDPDALEMTAAQTGASVFYGMYGNTSGVTQRSDVGAGSTPWAPIVFAFTLPPASAATVFNTINVRFEIVGVVEYAPPVNVFTYRLCKTPARGTSAAVDAWMKDQDRLLRQGILASKANVSSGMARTPNYILGMR